MFEVENKYVKSTKVDNASSASSKIKIIIIIIKIQTCRHDLFYSWPTHGHGAFFLYISYFLKK